MRHWPFVCSLTALLSACAAVGPDYHPPQVANPKQWGTLLGATASTRSLVRLDSWWQRFNDPLLNQLITDTLAANLDLKQALVKIKDARAQRYATFAGVLPEVTGKSTVSRRYNNTSGTSPTGGSGGFGVGNNLINIFQSGFDAQWELDFFGGVQRALEAADATIESEIENSHAVQVSLLGEVARNYIDLRTNQQLLMVTQANITAQQDSLTLTEVRQQAGFASMLDVSQAQALLTTTSAQLPVYQTAVKQAIHALGVLSGRQPEALAARLDQAGQIPVISSAAFSELPSELLKRRPDIRRAERLMAVANATVGVAVAELYPKINLTAFLGLQNMRITDMTPIGKSWSTAASLTLPIWNWGRINADIKSKQAQSEQTVLAYQGVILAAFKEVEDALVAYSQEQQRQQSLAQAVSANQLAVALAGERYQKGLTGFLDVLSAQQMLYQAQSSLVSSKAALAQNLVVLYKALGGGWQMLS
ncbi:MAG: efflux transporter outer membrane subunit [Methylovulum sp.]|nr:efflux transporter outer membrane subunit [Methylovulum sp.]